MITAKIDKKQLRMALCSAVLILIAQIIGNVAVIAVALIFYLYTVINAPKGYIIPLMLFFLPWSPILKLSPDSISFVSIATVLVWALFMLRNVSIKINAVLPIIGLLVITLLSKAFHNYSLATSYIMFFVMLIAFSVIYSNCSDQTSFETAAVFFSLGIILATISSKLFVESTNIGRYIVVMEEEYIGVTRLCGFYADPNFYAAQIIPAVGALLCVTLFKGKKNIINVVLIVALIICGLTSVSKSFLICLILVFAIWVLNVLISKPSKFLIIAFLLPVCVFLVLASGALSDVINQYLVRFEMSTDVNSLTTGRSDLWEEYTTFFIDHPLEAMFGQGYTSVFNGVRKGSHNTLIQMIYQLGILGCAFIVWWLLSFKKSTNKSKSKITFFYAILLIVACFSMWFGLDILFFDDFFLMIMLFFLGMNNTQAEDEVKK